MPPRNFVTVGTRKQTHQNDARQLKRRIQDELIPALDAGGDGAPLIEELQSKFDVVLSVQNTADWFVDPETGNLRGWGFNVFDADLDPPPAG
jgi:hypothetical protein